MEGKALFCRNCNEVVAHEAIGRNRNRKGLFGKGEPVYACKVCRCRRTDGPTYGPGMDCRVESDA